MVIEFNFTKLSQEEQINIINLVKNQPTKLSEISNEILQSDNPLKFKESIYLICSLPNTQSDTLCSFWNKVIQLQSDEKFIHLLAIHPNTNSSTLEDIYNAIDEINSMTHVKKVGILCDIANNPNVNLKLLIFLTKCHSDNIAQIVYQKLEKYYT